MKPLFLFKHFFADISILANIFGSGLAIFVGWITRIAPRSIAYMMVPLSLGFIIGFVIILWENWRTKTRNTKNRISIIPHNIQGILLFGILVVPINEVRFSCFLVYFAYHMMMFIALLHWQRQEGKRFRWMDLFP